MRHLSEVEARAMTVNERLASVGLLSDFDNALARRDASALQKILEGVYLSPSEAASVIAQVFHPVWAVRVQLVRTFGLRPLDWTRANDLLLNDLVGARSHGLESELDRARVQMAVLKLAAGDVVQLEHWTRQAVLDAQSVLRAAGLSQANWKQVLASEGFAVPGGIENEPDQVS